LLRLRLLRLCWLLAYSAAWVWLLLLLDCSVIWRL
jgi:hypothetical protein